MNEKIKELMSIICEGQTSIQRTEVENYINNLQSKIDKAIEILGQYKHLSSPTEEQAEEQEEIVSTAYDILKEE